LLCDNRRDYVERLHTLVSPRIERTNGSTTKIMCCDNADALRELARLIDEVDRSRKPIGVVFVDPNGSSEDNGFPLTALKWFYSRPRHSGIDLILSLNFSVFARVRGFNKNNPGNKGFTNYHDPRDVCGLKPYKRYWLVRNPNYSKGDRFAMFFGSNHFAGMEGFEDFVPLDSVKGQEIVNNLRRIQMDQPDLFEDFRNEP
jgi:hypothetical protein